MSEAFDIRREEGESKGRYVLRLDGHEAVMTYSRLGAASIIIDHTEVPEALKGRGAGRALVQRGVEDARAEGRCAPSPRPRSPAIRTGRTCCSGCLRRAIGYLGLSPANRPACEYALMGGDG
jgi:predicted GNAT family acetyltransferase